EHDEPRVRRVDPVWRGVLPPCSRTRMTENTDLHGPTPARDRNPAFMDEAGLDSTTTTKMSNQSKGNTVKKRSPISLVTAGVLVAGLAGCTPAAGPGDDNTGEGGLIGVAMPTKSSERW